MFDRIQTAAATLALAAGLSSQTRVVVPAEAKRAEGDAISAAPFAYDRARVSQYYGATLLRGLIPLGKSITEIAYRRDGQALNTQLLRHTSTPKWEIRMGRYTLDAANPSTRFLRPGTTANTLQPVFVKSAFRFPDLPGGVGPMEFRLRFKLDRPFIYNGDALVVDHFVYELRAPVFAYYIDAVRKGIDFGSYTAYGQSCPAGKNRASAIPSNPGGRPFSLILLGGRPSSPAMAILGGSRTRWGSATLPIDLSVLGMKGCSLYASIDMMIPVVTFTSGGATLKFDIPADRQLAGAKLYGQWLVVDPQVNPAVPLTMSNGVDITLGRTVGKDSGLDGAMVFGVGTVARSSYGFLDKGIVLVTEFTWQ